jgi:hypothetical protein
MKPIDLNIDRERDSILMKLKEWSRYNNTHENYNKVNELLQKNDLYTLQVICEKIEEFTNKEIKFRNKWWK